MTYDQRLVEEGNYVAEYYGKWHSPDRLASVYQNEIDTKTFNLFGPYWRFLNSRGYSIPEFPIREGLVIDSMTQRGYKPVPLDTRYLPENRNTTPTCECDQYGFQKISPGRTITAFEAKRVIRAISRLGGLKKAPFSLHVSFNSPHAPHTPIRKFAKLYQPRDMPVPPSINDTMVDSPYAFLRKAKYSDPATIGYFIRLYYAQVKEVDHWIGRILGKLDRKGFTNNTMLVFTSDHGEMMGNHGFIEKGVLYEESARIPMLMRFPGRIPAGTVVDETVSHLDVFATILDYMGLAAQPSDGESLRSLIEKAQPTAASTSAPPSAAPTSSPTTEQPHFTVVETGDFYQQFMLRSGDWKLIISNRAQSRFLTVLYNLKDDPHEIVNLIGPSNPDRANYLAKANELKELLVQWCVKTNSPYTRGMRQRVIR